jgi:predicted permease
MLAVVVGTLAAAVAVLVLWHRLRKAVDGATFTSIFQGGVRFNTYIALAVAQSFYGAQGLALGAVAAGFLILLINLLCISAFAVWGKGAYSGLRPLLREVFANPLILACILGWFLSLSGLGLPRLAADVLEIIGRAALPFGLLAVGAALRPGALHGHIMPIGVASVVQFGLKPLVAVGLLAAGGLSGVPAGVLLIAFMTPTAPSAYILARQLGGDTTTMASIITFQTLLAFAAMPLIAWAVLE